MMADSALAWLNLDGLSLWQGGMVIWLSPWVFTLWPAPWVWMWWRRRFMRQQADAYSGDKLKLPAGIWQDLTLGGRASRPWPLGALFKRMGAEQVLIWTCLVVAAAGPRWMLPPQQGDWTGRDWVVALDVSGSMGTMDFRWTGRPMTRLAAVQRQLSHFIQRRGGDRIGLVVFGGQAHLHTPLTTDTVAVVDALSQIEVGLLGQDTALGDAMALSVKYLDQQPPGHRTLMVVTDGDQTSGQLSPERALWLAKRAGVRVMLLLVSDDPQTLQPWVNTSQNDRLEVVRIHDAPALTTWLNGLDAQARRQVQTTRAQSALPLYPYFLILAALAWSWRAAWLTLRRRRVAS